MSILLSIVDASTTLPDSCSLLVELNSCIPAAFTKLTASSAFMIFAVFAVFIPPAPLALLTPFMKHPACFEALANI